MSHTENPCTPVLVWCFGGIGGVILLLIFMYIADRLGWAYVAAFETASTM